MFDDFFSSFLVCALWSSSDSDDTPLDANYSCDDIAPEALAYLRADCERFWKENEATINCEGAPNANDGTGRAGMAGHDFWLTRNGHGAGFWDGDWPEPYATQLSDSATAFGTVNLYVGDDGKIYA